MTETLPKAAGTAAAARPTASRARGPWRVISAAVAMFLVVFALMTARVVTGTDPGLQTSAQTQVLAKSGKTVLRTTASGRVVREAAPQAGAKAGAPLLTHASGAAGERDG